MNVLTTTFYQLFGDNLPARPEKIAIIDGDREVTYEQLGVEIDKVANYLSARGIAAGDRVIVHLRKSVEEVVAMFAVAKVGAVVVNVNYQWTAEQLEYVADDCEARLMIVDERVATGLDTSGLPYSVSHVLVKRSTSASVSFDSWNELSDSKPNPEVVRLETELAMIIYTSGSTGRPKGVMLTHNNIITGARSVARYLKLRDDDRLLSVLPYSFDYGLNQLTTMMLMGGTVVHQVVTMATELVRTMVRHQVTGVAAVPPLWGQIARLLDGSPETFPALRRITNSGGKIPLNILELFPKAFPGVDIYLMYGLTEAFRSTFLAPEKFMRKMGAIGRAIPGSEIYVIKHGEGIAGPGEQGELVHRGPLISLGYWGKPEATADKIRPCPELRDLIGDEPVVYSGDIVRLDEDGDLWFVSRNDSLIKTSGFRVSPDEIEDLVSRSGLVADVVAFGVDAGDLGQVVHVAVTPLEGFSEASLLKYCRQSMPSYMVPHRFHVWAQPMPRTASGKLARPDVLRSCSEAIQAESLAAANPSSGHTISH